MRWLFAVMAAMSAAYFLAARYLIDDTPAPRLVPAAQQACDPARDRPTGAELQAMTPREAEDLRAERAACVAQRTGGAAPSPRGLWYVRREASPMTGQNNVTAALPAEHEVPIRSYRTTRPKLYIRCHENVTAVLIDFGALITTDRTSLRLRIGERPPRTAVWRMSTDYEAAGLWRGGEAIPFVKSLLGQPRLLVEVTPHSESTKLVEFDLTGIGEAVKPVREECGW